MVHDISLTPGELPATLAGTEPELIYHYTDAGGLLGIVTNRGLWASDVWYMNDAREALYGLEVIERALKQLEPASSYEDNVRTAAIKQLAELQDGDDIPHSYIACLSKQGDDLSQWRAYGRPRGYSIGFDRQALRRMSRPIPAIGHPVYREVNYEIAVQDGTVIDRFRLITGALENRGDQYARPDAAARMCILEALSYVPAFKHPAFSAEEEVRLQLYHDPEKGGVPAGLKFRNGQMGLTPYVEIGLCDQRTDQMGAIREIIIGPQPNQDEARRAVKQLLARYHGSRVEVRPSNVPLRP